MNTQRLLGWLDAMGVKVTKTNETKLEKYEEELNEKICDVSVYDQIKDFIECTSFPGQIVVETNATYIGDRKESLLFILNGWVGFCDSSGEEVITILRVRT